jgi:hypothetical protein
MGRLSAKLRSLEGNKVAFWCPGCNQAHAINIGRNGWMWNLDTEHPTFSPSVLVTYAGEDASTNEAPPSRCHSFVREGKIEFLSDCTHALRGQTVELRDWPRADKGNEQ